MLSDVFNADVEVVHIVPMGQHGHDEHVHEHDENDMHMNDTAHDNHPHHGNETNAELELDSKLIEGRKKPSIEVKEFKHHEDHDSEHNDSHEG